MTLSPDDGNDLAVGNLVRGDGRLEHSHRLQAPITSGQLILNLRAETDPESLKAVVMSALQSTAADFRVAVRIEHLEHFRPGKPTPTHRLAEV
jgi:hypothetical protein